MMHCRYSATLRQQSNHALCTAPSLYAVLGIREKKNKCTAKANQRTKKGLLEQGKEMSGQGKEVAERGGGAPRKTKESAQNPWGYTRKN